MRSYRFVFTPKWLAFHALTWLILIPAFLWLAHWQHDLWNSHQGSDNVVLDKLAAKPVPLDTQDAAGHTVTQAQQWTVVTATGHYDTAHQFMVRNRSQNENPGWYVVTPLELSDGTALLVNQGWVAEQDQVDSPLDHPPFPPVPSGTVTVTGSLQPDETTTTTRIRDDSASLPTDELALITKADVSSRVPYQLRDGSIELISSTPANTSGAAAQPIPAPSYDNTIYIAYTIQWIVFAIIMPITWLKLIQREAAELRRAERGEDDDDDDFDDEDDEEEEDDEPDVAAGPGVTSAVSAGSTSTAESNGAAEPTTSVTAEV